MFELEKTSEVQRLLSITKSSSGITGPILAQAHMQLGALLADTLSVDPDDTTVVAVLRGGIFFAEGLYFRLACKFELYDPKNGAFVRPKTKHIILADSVINTGATIKEIYKPDMIVACCVINEHAVRYFEDNLYTVRVSKNYYIGANVTKQAGSKGPDTTMRLFNQL